MTRTIADRRILVVKKRLGIAKLKMLYPALFSEMGVSVRDNTIRHFYVLSFCIKKNHHARFLFFFRVLCVPVSDLYQHQQQLHASLKAC